MSVSDEINATGSTTDLNGTYVRKNSLVFSLSPKTLFYMLAGIVTIVAGNVGGSALSAALGLSNNNQPVISNDFIDDQVVVHKAIVNKFNSTDVQLKEIDNKVVFISEFQIERAAQEDALKVVASIKDPAKRVEKFSYLLGKNKARLKDNRGSCATIDCD